MVDPRRRVLVTLEVCGLEGRQETVEFQVDTGFSGQLSLPLEVVKRLGLVQSDTIYTRLADNSRVEVPLFSGGVVWDGIERSAAVIAAGRQPLLGTGLLDGHRLCSDITPAAG